MIMTLDSAIAIDRIVEQSDKFIDNCIEPIRYAIERDMYDSRGELTVRFVKQAYLLNDFIDELKSFNRDAYYFRSMLKRLEDY